MVGGAGLPWALVDIRGGIPVHEYSVPRGIASADGRAVLVLGLFGGRERDEAQWRALLAAGGFEPVSVEDGLIEARCH